MEQIRRKLVELGIDPKLLQVITMIQLRVLYNYQLFILKVELEESNQESLEYSHEEASSKVFHDFFSGCNGINCIVYCNSYLKWIIASARVKKRRNIESQMKRYQLLCNLQESLHIWICCAHTSKFPKCIILHLQKAHIAKSI